MDNNVPLAVVGPELERIPPIRVKGPVRETSNLGPEVEPTVEKSEEPHNQKQDWRQHQIADGDAEGRKVQMFLQILNGLLHPGLVKNEGWVREWVP